eukprot:GEMP01047411.1.p1 GENE.GEMP01047411.1~~GEMP01047411.1.p1  ORF type:complete len:357 (+),score=55.97 GEMP01047411.1:31-1101(+)
MDLPVDLTKWICSLSETGLPSNARMELTKEITSRGLDSKRWDSIVRSRETPSWATTIGVTEAMMAHMRRVWVSEFAAPDDISTECSPEKEPDQCKIRGAASGTSSGSGAAMAPVPPVVSSPLRFSRPSVPDLSLPEQCDRLDPSSVEYDTSLAEWQWTTPIPPRKDGRPGGFTQACEADRDRITAFYRFQGLPSVSDGLVTSELCPRVYCGPMADAACLPLLKSLGITHILNLAHEVRYAEELRPFNSHRITYSHLPIHDTVDQVKLCLHEKEFATLRQATGFVHKTLSDPSTTLLVHCVQGLSRAPTIVASYMMEYLGYSLNAAVDEIRQAHSGAFLPFRFEELLRAFEKNCATA